MKTYNIRWRDDSGKPIMTMMGVTAPTLYEAVANCIITMERQNILKTIAHAAAMDAWVA